MSDRSKVTEFLNDYMAVCSKHGMKFQVECTEDHEYDPSNPPPLAVIHIVTTDSDSDVEADFKVLDCDGREDLV